MESNPTKPNSNMATHCALCALLDKKSPSIESNTNPLAKKNIHIKTILTVLHLPQAYET